MMKKRLLCALLLLALALSLLPTVALADDANTAGTAEELQSLLGQRKTPIKLTDNINLNEKTLTISGGNITIDMDGHTIFGGNLIVDVRETRPLNLTGEGVIDCPATLNGTICGDAEFQQEVTLAPNDACKIYGGSFYGKITTRSSTDAVEFNGGTFYNTVNTAGCNSVTVYGGVFHEDAKFLCGAGQSNVFGGVFYKNVQAAGSNGSTNNIWAGMFFDTSVASQFAEGTVSMNVIFHANGGASETVTAKAVANRTPEYSALIAPPKPLPTKDGYVLTGWYTDSVGGTSFMFDQKWTVGMIEEQQDRTITLYARWEKAPEEPEETDSFPALAAGALLCQPGHWQAGSAEDAAAVAAGAVFFFGAGTGIVEEAVFRGVLMTAVERRWNKTAAVLGPSLAFALLHVLGRELSFAGILQLLAAGTAVGVLFSLVAYESGTVWCGAAMHAVWNMVMIGGVLHIGPEPDGYALLNYVLDSASPLVTGGDFGVEASLPSIAVYLGFSALALVRLKRSKAFAHTA